MQSSSQDLLCRNLEQFNHVHSVQLMEQSRTVLDINSLLKKLMERFPGDLANILYRNFRAVSIVIEPNLLIEIIESPVQGVSNEAQDDY